jgi:hypothetical protein
MKTIFSAGAVAVAVAFVATLQADPGTTGSGPALDVAKPRVKVISPNGGERFESQAPIRVTWEVSVGALAKQRFWFVLIEKMTPVGGKPSTESRRIENPGFTDWMSGGLDVDSESSPRRSRRFSATLTAGTSGKDRQPKRLVPGQYRVTVFGIDIDEYRRLGRKGDYDSISRLMRDAAIIDTCDRSFTIFSAPTPPAGRK